MKSDRASIDWWVRRVLLNHKSATAQIVRSLQSELPNMISLTLERTCNLQCSHCLYPLSPSSRRFSEEAGLMGIVENIVRQMPYKDEEGLHTDEDPCLLHEGRILQKWHLDIFEMIRRVRPDIRLGLIDNGTYVRHINEFKRKDLRLDWLDISIDGTEESHNAQRDPLGRAHAQAVEGLRQARRVVGTEGRVSSLMTLSSLNCSDVEQAADFLFGEKLVDQFHITTMSPKLAPNFDIEMSVEGLTVAWSLIRRVMKKYPGKVFFRIYRTKDLEKLSRVVGTHVMRNAAHTASVDIGRIELDLEGVAVSFFPNSTWPQESILIDADGVNRVAYSMRFTLPELRSGKALDGTDTRPYSVLPLDTKSDLTTVFEHGVHQWWDHFGKNYLAEEMKFFQSLERS